MYATNAITATCEKTKLLWDSAKSMLNIKIKRDQNVEIKR